MKLNIDRFFDGYSDEDDIDMEMDLIDRKDINTERIKSMTMNKIKSEGKGKMKKSVRAFLLIAAAAVLLTGTAFAAAAGIRATKVSGSKEFTDGDNTYSYSDIGAIIDVDGKNASLPSIIAMKPAYQPEMDEANVQETVDMVQGRSDATRTTAYYLLLSEDTGITDINELYDYEWASSLNIDDYADRIDALLEKSGVTGEQFAGAYTHIYRNDGNKAWGIDACEISNNDASFYLEGNTDIIREDILNGMNAIYMVNHFGGDDPYDMNVIALHNVNTGILFTVYGNVGFDELEKIAVNTELIDTDIPCIYTEDDGFGGMLASLSQG